jgi:hypothetical protein
MRVCYALLTCINLLGLAQWLVRHRRTFVCYLTALSVQNLLSSRLLSQNVKIRMYGTIIVPVVMCGRETWSLTLTL